MQTQMLIRKFCHVALFPFSSGHPDFIHPNGSKTLGLYQTKPTTKLDKAATKTAK